MNEAKTKAEYCLLLCIDYRIQETFYDWIKEKHLLGKSDIIEIAGSSRDLALPIKDMDKEELLREIDISVKLHNPKYIFLFDHQDCGAYAQDQTIPNGLALESDLEKHKFYAQRAKQILEKKYSGVTIKIFYITLDHRILELG